ncbi:MAG: patatin-like phospholipase family protein [Anaerolineales bacterium]|nr:patatin-like phospholipase family protein [Anaerolineales bacterium]
MKALNEAGIYPEVISGVSAGAIVGALYADGHTPDRIFEIFSEEKSFFKYVKFIVPRKGMFKTAGLKENLSKNLNAKTFEELKLPLFVAATDISRGEIVYFNSGEIVDRVLASAAIPVLFEPVEIDGNLFVDGGVLDNFPVTPLAKDCMQLVGISLNPICAADHFNSLFKIAERTFHLSVSSNITPKIARCDMVFEPEELGNYGLLDASKGREMFDLGYRMAAKLLKLN